MKHLLHLFAFLALTLTARADPWSITGGGNWDGVDPMGDAYITYTDGTATLEYSQNWVGDTYISYGSEMYISSGYEPPAVASWQALEAAAGQALPDPGAVMPGAWGVAYNSYASYEPPDPPSENAFIAAVGDVAGFWESVRFLLIAIAGVAVAIFFLKKTAKAKAGR